MALIGPPIWNMLTTDHIGVPHGGLFGDPQRWEPELKKHGLHLGWLPNWEHFAVYTILPGGEFVAQMMLKHKDRGPITIDRQLVDTLVFLRETHNRSDRKLLEAAVKRRQDAANAKVDAEAAEERSDRARRAVDTAFIKMGLKTPKVTVTVPGQRSKFQ